MPPPIHRLNALLPSAALAIAALSVGYCLGHHTAPPPAPAPHLAPAKDSYQFFDTLVDLRSQILHNYVENVDDQKLLNGAIKGMMAELDPYSNYFAKDELANFDRIVHGQFSGIGAEILQDTTTGAFIIVSPLEDSPALKAGVAAGDRILKANGESVEGQSLKELLTKISGAPNSQLKLTVLHEGDKTPVDLTITRQVIQIHSVRGVSHEGVDMASGAGWNFLVDSDHRIAYVRITTFMENTADELDKALLPLLNDKTNGSLRGIILDLRFNPGGLLQAGIDVSKRFLDSGVIVSTGRPDSAKRDFVAEATKEKTYPRIPLVVLINEYSASASEIVAGALKDHHRAVLIGARSFGKGSVQQVINLDNGNAALKLTTQYYYLPSGKNIMRKKDAKEWGVEPDPAFNIPLTKEENLAVRAAQANAEIIHRSTTTQPTTAPSAGADTDPLAPAAGAAAAATRPAEPADRQLQRALEILIAYQSFGPSKDFAVDVTTARPTASASVPTSSTAPTQPTPKETPADLPQ